MPVDTSLKQQFSGNHVAASSLGTGSAIQGPQASPSFLALQEASHSVLKQNEQLDFKPIKNGQVNIFGLG